jgi:hypothetical protein
MTKNNALAAVTIVILLAIGTSTALSIVNASRIGHAAHANCEEVQDVKRALRAVIGESSKFVSTSHVRTP